MPEMNIVAKLSMIALIGALVGFIVLYHLWMDRRLARERRRDHAERRAPAGPPAARADADRRGEAGADPVSSASAR